ncbi:MAG: hypothetical protein MUE40_21420 [Anaerolineae bacterium]|jgi:hypothetical protein|nr:hypothetical protein [Anaerolineae bacterium]
MAIRILEQGIQAVQAGNYEEGARLLRIALKDEQMPPPLRALALMWLAATSSDPQFQLECYRQANAADPTNREITQRLAQLMQQMPPVPSATGTMPAVNPNTPPYGLSPAGYPAPSTGYVQQPIPAAPPVHPNTPPYGAPPVNPNTPAYGMPPVNPNTPPYGAPPVSTTTGTMPAVAPPPYGAVALPPAQPGALPAQKLLIQGVQRTVGIVGGPNGRGTGFFATRDGLIATTRHVVGGLLEVELELLTGQRLAGQVVRSFPAYDLALVQANVVVNDLLHVTQMPVLPDNTPIAVVAHRGEPIRTQRRETRHATAPFWFPTTLTTLQDAGGDTVFDATNLLVGIMTRNASRSNHLLYGLHITIIYKAIEQYLREMQQMEGKGAYCRHCGSLSRAGLFGAYYCETCGTTLPASLEITRHPLPNTGALYGENMNRPCPNCRSTVGYYAGQCLRCGYDVSKAGAQR